MPSGHRPGPTKAAAETGAERSPPESCALKEGGRLPHRGRCHRGAMTEGVTAERSRRGDKIPAGGSPEEFSCPARSRAPPPSRLPARSVRTRAPLALAHPPPVRGMSEGGWLASTGGGDYSIHLISKGAIVASGDRPSPTEAAAETRPFGTPCTRPGLSGPLGGARGAKPRLVEGLQGDPSPCGGIQRGACPPLRIQLRESYPPPNPLPRTKSLRRGHRSGAGGGF